MTKLKFELGNKEDEKAFEYVYNGFIIGGALTQTKGIVALRREIGLLDKLHAISKDCECGKKIVNDEVSRELIGGEVELEKPELDMLINYISIVPWSTGRSGRDAVKIIDWLSSL